MKRIYDLKLIYDYIWGNDIVEYSVDDLENDPDFMLQVIERTKDKKMYELCSESVKRDYGFVREVIELFKDDLDFVSSVADTYIDFLTDADKLHGIYYNELNIIMSNLFGKRLNEYVVMAAGFYEYERQRALLCINSVDDSSLKEESKAGFLISAVQYEESPIILDFIAKRMLNESIYGERYNNLEYLIHSRFKSVEEFERYGEELFLQDCVNGYDQTLCSYVFGTDTVSFQNFFGEIFKDISHVKNGWSLYMDRINSWRVNVFQHDMSKYMLENGSFGRLSYDEIVSYATNKLGVVDVFKKYDPEFSFSYDEEKHRILDTEDVRCLNKACELATSLFSVDVIDDSYDDYVDSDGEKNSSVQYSGSQKIVRFQLANVEDKKAIR